VRTPCFTGFGRGLRRGWPAACVVTLCASFNVGAWAIAATAPPCPSQSPDWELYPDSATAMPAFFYRASVDIQEIIVCPDGIFFIFPSEEQGETRRACLAYLRPTQAREARYNRTASLDVERKSLEVLGATARNLREYDVFREKLRELLGRAYKEDAAIRFGRRSGERPALVLDNPFRISWRGRDVTFQTLIEVYYKKKS
jgi:hypothetical protein